MRNIIRTPQFEEELQALPAPSPAVTEFLATAEFLLARDPLTGSEINARDRVWFMPMAPLEDLSLAIYYTFDYQQVIFLSIAAL